MAHQVRYSQWQTMSIKTRVESTKKPYVAPKLVVYGDLTEMTLIMTGFMGMMEMATGTKRT